MDRCRTCKWSEWAVSEWGVCHRFDTYAEVDDQQHAGALAVPRVFIKGHAAQTLTVHHSFGCVQHEPREDAQ
jgi:hypothetical protein